MEYTTSHPVQETDMPNKILMSSSAGEQTIQVVEHQDRTLTIMVDQITPNHYRWQPNQVEACIRTYMRLLRR